MYEFERLQAAQHEEEVIYATADSVQSNQGSAGSTTTGADHQEVPLSTLFQLRSEQSRIINDTNQERFSSNLKLWIDLVIEQLPQQCWHDRNNVPAKCK